MKAAYFYAEISDDIIRARLLTGFIDYRRMENRPVLTYVSGSDRKAKALKSDDPNFFIVATLLHQFHPDMDVFEEMRKYLKEEWERLLSVPDEERDDYEVSECQRMMVKFGAI